MVNNHLKYLIILLSLPQLSMTLGWDEFGILDSDDIQTVQNQVTPALESPLGEEPPWEVFNEWICFRSDSVQAGCYEEKSGIKVESLASDDIEDRRYFSTLLVEDENKLHAFESPDAMEFTYCQEQTRKWRHILGNQEGFCVFGAKLPHQISESDEVENWVIYGIKSHAGRILAPIYDPEEAKENNSQQSVDNGDQI